MFKKIDHIEIIPLHLDKTIAFYSDVLGFKIKERKRIPIPPLEEVIYLTLNDTTIELLSVKGPAPVSVQQWQVGYRMLAIEVDDMDQAVTFLKGKGVEISRGPVATGKSQRAEIRDPNGLSIELRQW